MHKRVAFSILAIVLMAVLAISVLLYVRQTRIDKQKAASSKSTSKRPGYEREAHFEGLGATPVYE